MLLSSTKVLMLINAFSNDVSFKSAIVVARLANVPPPASVCAVLIKETPSPPVKLELNALFNTLAALTCLV